MGEDREIKRALRYVAAHPNKTSPRYWYWQRKGFPLVRLPDDPVQRLEKARRLNERADRGETAHLFEPTEGSVKWVIDKYRQSDRYKRLAAGTRIYYDNYLTRVGDKLGSLPFKTAMTRKVTMTIIESMTASRQRHMAAVLSLLFDTAMRWGFADANLAKDPGIQHQSRRDQVWSASDIAAFMTHARNHFAADALVTAFTLLLFTAQRPSDVLSMRRDQYKDGWFRIRQQKTKALVEAPLHKAAVPVIEAALKRPSLFLVSRQDGQPIKQVTMNRWFREVQEKAGIQNLQPRDLRRTAIVLMGEAGVSIQMIAAVSGHTKDSVMKIIETYMPSTRAMAESAIRGWEEHQARTDRQGGV